MASVKYMKDISALDPIPEVQRSMLAQVAQRYPFRANDYYLSLIDWDDPADPIRRIVIPQAGELLPFGHLDASGEMDNYVVPGCQHKYRDTALLLVSEVCGGYCRFCFRKRLFMRDVREAASDPGPGIDYIRRRSEITNVLLSGGDPLLLSTTRLERILAALREIEHVGIIRIGTKMPVYNPMSITEDEKLLAVLARYSRPGKRIYVITHINHPRELTGQALQALDCLHRTGVVLANQTPILRGINADPRVLADLMQRLSFAGVPPYYFFQCRPTEGNKPFVLPIVQSYEVLRRAMSRVSGLARRARLIMSHARGKVEVQAVTETRIICRFHRARDPEDDGRIMIFDRDDRAYWFDELLAQKSLQVQRAATRLHARAARRGADGFHFADRRRHD